ncbi:unnamed protein product [Symbiodinium sp. CCMP2456]|nr:unnamed protein product [Symbiodinium sp. CCMP2456]
MMSFTALSEKTTEALPSKDGVISLTNLADELGSMSLDDLVSNGGSYIVLREGEALLIPPGFFFFQCGLGYMNAPKTFYKAFAAVPKPFVHEKDVLQTVEDQFEVAHHHAAGVKKIVAAISSGWKLMDFLSSGLRSTDVKPEAASTPRPEGAPSPATEPKLILDYYTPNIDYHDLFAQDGADLEWEISRAKKHELFPQYVASLQGDVEDDWEFGDMEGDALADIEHFCEWLQKRQSSATQVADKEAIKSTEANADDGTEAADKQEIHDTVAIADAGTEAADRQEIHDAVANATDGTEAADKREIDNTVANAADERAMDITVANAKEGASGASCRAFEGQVAELQKKMGNLQPGEEPFSPGVKVPDYAALPGAADLEKLADVAALQAELGEREVPAGAVLSEAEVAVYEMRQTLLSRKAAAAQDPSAEQDPAKQKTAVQSLVQQAKQNPVPVNNPARAGTLQDYLLRGAASAKPKEKDKKEPKAKAKVKADEGP